MKNMRRIIAMLLTLVTVFSLSAGAFAAEWKDVPKGIWYEKYVSSVVKAGLMNGVGEGTFAPAQTLNRAMFVTILNRAAGATEVASSTTYKDVSKGAWYFNAVQWAAAQSIVTGYTDGRFGVNDPLTREQMVTILYRFVSANQKVNASAAALDTFADKAAVSSYAVDAFRWAVTEGIISGKGAGLLDPKGTSTRAEAATVITRFLEYTEKKYEKLTRAELEEAVAELAFSYYLKGAAFQYDSEDKSDVFGRYYGGTYRLTEGALPEHGTSHTTIYSVCSDYVFKTYYAALGYRMYGSPSYSDAVTTAVWLFSEREGMLLKRWASADYQMTDDDRKYGVTEQSFCSMEEMQEFVRNWKQNLRPGDVLLPTGHAMLYVGNGYVLDCAGSKYDMKQGVDKIETNGAIKYLHKIDELLFTKTGPMGDFTTLTDFNKKYFCVVRPLNALVQDDGDGNPANDKVKSGIFSMPAATKSRLQYKGLEVNRTVNITPYGTTFNGDTLTYNVAVTNNSNENFYKTYKQYADPAYAGVAYKGLVVTEKIPAGTQLVAGSISNGGTVSGNTIKWTLDIPAGEVRNLTYKVKVTAQQGQQIVSGGGSVAQIPSNTIVNKVGGKQLNEAALQGLRQFAVDGENVWRAKYNVSALSTGTEFAERIYAKAMGLDVQLPTIEEFMANVLERKSLINGPSSIRYSGMRSGKPLMLRENVSAEYKPYKDMIVGNMIGGRMMHFTSNEQTADEFMPEYLIPGDVLVLADLNDNYTLESSMVVVVLTGGKVAFVSSDNKMASGSSVKYLFASALGKDLFFVLRPSQALADVNAKPYNSANEPTYGEEPSRNSLDSAPISAENAAKFKALQSDEKWSGKNTTFAEEVYAKAGLDLKKAMNSMSVVTIVKNIFSVYGGNASTSKYSYEPINIAMLAETVAPVRNMLVDELRGGPDMIEDPAIHEPKAADLQVGDVLYLVKRSGSVYWVGVYLGDNKMIMSEYTSGKDPVYKLYDVADEAAFSKLLKQNPNDGVAWEFYMVLRPSRGFADINTGKTFF